jgi:hypothetical protein
MATQNGPTDLHHKLKQSSSQQDAQESIKRSEPIAMRETAEKIEVPATQPPPIIKEQPGTQSLNSDQDMPDVEPKTNRDNETTLSPHTLEPFDWDDFQARYDQAMVEASATEQNLLNEFQELANASGLTVSFVSFC